MNHRIVNNVGYTKIYPMSDKEDDSFCHYCGRKPSITVSLEWDHVPALNVLIPPEHKNSCKKTLIRSCRECNGIASDVPHLDYLSRHFWLKAAYLRKYKRLLENEGALNSDTKNLSSYLKAVINNENYRYEDVLRMIGFGLINFEEIESPILQVKTRSGKKIIDILYGYLHGVPSIDDEDEKIEEAPEDLSEYCAFFEFIEFLLEEMSEIIFELNQEVYSQKFHEQKFMFKNANVPEKPSEYYKLPWSDILKILNIVIENTKKRRRVTPYFIDELRDEFLANQEYCDLDSFIEIMTLEKLRNIERKKYLNWYKKNINRAQLLNIPEIPYEIYQIEWSELSELINREIDKYESELAVDEFDESELEIDEFSKVGDFVKYDIDKVEQPLDINVLKLFAEAKEKSRSEKEVFHSFSYKGNVLKVKMLEDNDLIFKVGSVCVDEESAYKMILSISREM